LFSLRFHFDSAPSALRARERHCERMCGKSVWGVDGAKNQRTTVGPSCPRHFVWYEPSRTRTSWDIGQEMDASDYLAVLIIARAVAQRRKASVAPVFGLDGVRTSLADDHGIFLTDDGERAVQIAFENLCSLGLLAAIVTPHAKRRYRADDVNVFLFQESQGPFQGELRKAVDLYRELGQEWLIESLQNALDGRYVEDVPFPPTEAPWSPLKLERPDPELDELSDKLGELAELVRSDNGYAHDESGERDDIVARLKAAASYVRTASLFTSSAVAVYVTWPLERLIARFGSAAIGAASKVALDLFTSWLKKRVGLD